MLKYYVKTKNKLSVRQFSHLFDLATAIFRATPDFLIIGAMKSGTSSLFHYLSQHPQIIPSIKKEIHYFDGGQDSNVDTYLNGHAWYRAHFPLKVSLKPGMISGEASPRYLYDPRAPERIATFKSDIKLIAILRNPTDRAISQYFHEQRKGRETATIMDALISEDTLLQPVIERGDYKSSTYIHCSYKDRGIYEKQIARYLRQFSRNQLLILESKEFFENPQKILKKTFDFLDVEPTFVPLDLAAKNVSSNRRAVGSEVYDFLDDFFFRHNQRLYKLIRRNYHW